MAQPVAEHAFACAACNAQAGVVRLFGPAERAEIVRESVTSRLTLRVDAGAFDTVQRLIAAGDIAGRDQPLHGVERAGIDAQREAAGNALADDLGTLGGAEEPHHARLRVARGTGEGVLCD